MTFRNKTTTRLYENKKQNDKFYLVESSSLLVV